MDEEAELGNTEMFQTEVLLATGRKIFDEVLCEVEKELKDILSWDLAL